jgi:AraC-like DNA-binding protein
MEPMVRAAALINYFEVAQALRFNPRSLFREVGIDASVLAHPDEPLPAKQVVRLLEESARQSGDPCFALRMAESRNAAGLGVVGLLLTHVRSLREALRIAIEYRQLVNETIAIDSEDVGRYVVIRAEVLPVLGTYSRQATELALGVLVGMCRALLGKRWHPVSAHFAHSAPPDTSTHERLFGCPVRFDGEYNAINCASRDLDGPNPLADPLMVRQLEQSVRTLRKANPGSTVLAAQREVMLLLPLGQATVERVAARLEASVRTLQRQLEDEDCTFTGLVESVQRDLVMRYLANRRYSVKDVADLLGYSSQSAFGRWFKKEYGCSPRQWRDRSQRAERP